MTKNELRSYRGRLRAMASRLRIDIIRKHDADLMATTKYSGLGSESANVAAHAVEEGQVQTLVTSEEHTLDDINAALDRFAIGTFGQCLSCQRPLARKRLEAIPYARFCIECAERSESASGAV